MAHPQHSPRPPDDLTVRAVAVVEEFLRRLGVPGSVTCRDRRGERPPHLWLEIVTASQESGLLIGERGVHLRALEHLVRLLLREHLQVTCRLFLDVNAYRLRRMEFLKRLARDSARRVMESRHAVTLEPMPAMERRIVHLALTGEASVATVSVGVEPERRVVIRPRDPFLTPGDHKALLRQRSLPSERTVSTIHESEPEANSG